MKPVTAVFRRIRAAAEASLFLLFLYVFAILIPWVIITMHFGEEVAADWFSLRALVGLLFIGIAAVLVGFNLNTSFVWPWLHKRKHGNLEDYQNVSGAPIVASLLILFGAIFCPQNTVLGVVLLLLFFIDTCGIHFAAIISTREFVFPKTDAA